LPPVPEILVVDDSRVIREMVAACLKPDSSLVVVQASSGLEAIEQLSLRRFDLMILDLNMPDIGGIEVLEFVRGQERLSALPIIIVTTRGDESSRASAMAAGASLYLTKPFEPEVILSHVRALLSGRAVS
jgi:two-component system, chemotaxis family, chemotaxis protein CheY